MTQRARALRRQRLPQFAVKASVHALLIALASTAVAQTTTDETPPQQQLQRVEVTGSAIKRIDAETALPVQIITREAIDKAGVTTAAELMSKISASSNNLTDGVSIATGGFRDQMGFNSANLRGLGTSSTLVLLNGRRMANFASPGDDSGVDLNNIPAAAIQRVEVLLDGASAIYGTDAIGGVINFITRKDFQGAEVSAYYGTTDEGGATKRTASIAAGIGNYDEDGFNVFGVLDAQTTDSLRTSQRKFISDLKIPQRLPYLLSSAPFPGNIRLTSDQRDYLESIGFAINGQPISTRTINLSAPTCNAPQSLYLPDGIGGVDGCTYDFMRDLELYPRTEKYSLLSRGVFKVSADQQLFAEVSYTRSRSWYVGTSNRIDGDMDVSMIPALAATGLGDALPDDRIITVRTRLLEAGNRTSQLTSEGQRMVVGTSGTKAGWDYDFGLNHSVNIVRERDTHGYLLYDKTMEGIANGLINPFGPSSAEGLAYLESIQVNDEVRHSTGEMNSIDLKGSHTLATLAGGDLALALGTELRREMQYFNPSALNVSDNILGDSAADGLYATSHGRNVFGLFGEIDAPISKQWELQFAARYDHYDQVGGTVNPKFGVRFQPTKELMFRGSASTGFRAPSLTDLYRPTSIGQTATLPDPVCMAANDNDLGYCADNWYTHRYSNPNLKPEKSRQFSLGAVFEPNQNLTMSLDYWNITKTDLISEIGDDVILGNLAKYGNLVHRYSDVTSDPSISADCPYDPTDDSICFIELRKENRGSQKSSGLDLVIDFHDLRTGLGKFGVRLNGTLALVSKQQTANGDPYVSNLGKFMTDGVVQRWRHRLTVDWEYGPVSASIANTFYSGYEDQNSAIDTNTGLVVDPNRVKPYSLWDLSGAYTVTKSLKLRGGINNVFDTAPPFSNQAYYFISGYDPSYTDPRGRFFYVSAQYAFK